MAGPKVAIISGVGVREYYEKNGYELVHNYMIKSSIIIIIARLMCN